MGRARLFDEAQVIQAAAVLFAVRPYDSVSVDDLVRHLGVHRNSLYKVFGSKRGLYTAALGWHLRNRVRRRLKLIATAPDRPAAAAESGEDLDFLLLAAAERAPADPDVARVVARAFQEFDTLLGPDETARMLGTRLRTRIPPPSASPPAPAPPEPAGLPPQRTVTSPRPSPAP